MQVNALLNILAAMPGSTADFLAGGVNGRGADALFGSTTPAVQEAGQFTGILNNKLSGGNLTALGTVIAGTNPDNPTGDITPSPQDSGIAIPPLSQFIDAPAQNGKALLPNYSNKDYTIAQLSDAANGKIRLDGLNTEGNIQVDEKEFAEAVTKLSRQQDMAQENAVKEQAELKAYEKAKILSATNAEINAEARKEKLAHLVPQAVGVSVTPKILSVKESTESDSLTNLSGLQPQEHSHNLRLAELDKQIRYNELANAKSASQDGTRIDQVHVKISQAIGSGAESVRIKLYPAELGQIDVDMKVDEDGKTSIRVIAERPEALDALRRDSHELERALREAGVKTESGGLEFSLRGDGQQENLFSMMNEQNNKHSHAKLEGYSKAAAVNETEMTLSLSAGGVNILA